MREVCIAVVDDDDQVRTATSSLLRSMGYATRTYSSAVSFLSDGVAQVDCVLSDYQMPQMTGLQLLESLRQRQVTVPVLIMSAHIGGDVAERASRMGSAGFIAKPLDEQALIEAISVALAQG